MMLRDTIPMVWQRLVRIYVSLLMFSLFRRQELRARLTSCVLIPLCTIAAFRLYLFTVSNKQNLYFSATHVNTPSRSTRKYKKRSQR